MSDAMREAFEEKVRSEIPGLSLRRYENALDAKDFGAEKGDYCVPITRDLWTGFRWSWQAALEHAGRGDIHPCWSCKRPVSIAQKRENDGDCPNCGSELDEKLWPQPPAPVVPVGYCSESTINDVKEYQVKRQPAGFAISAVPFEDMLVPLFAGKYGEINFYELIKELSSIARVLEEDGDEHGCAERIHALLSAAPEAPDQ